MNNSIEKKLRNEFYLMDISNIKPNFAALARKYGLDYRTVKKYYEGYEGKPKTRNKPSKLDPHKETIKEKFMIPRLSKKGVYEFLCDQYGADEIGTYSNFNAYCKKHNLIPGKNKKSGSTRYETSPGDMAQADWKESVHLVSKGGDSYTVNIFHLVLKFSRFSYIELTLSKEQNTVFRCLANAFKFYGGVPKRILFDNMSTAIDVSSRPKKVNSRMLQFSKDMNFTVQACKARHAFTKGTNEARNKMLDWIRAYNHEFKEYDDLVEIVKTINIKMNTEICAGINMPPSLLFFREKEYLSPLPSSDVLDSYTTPAKVSVSAQQLVCYKGIWYSVDRSLIGKYVYIEEFDDKLHIYYNGKIVHIHHITENPINYMEEHYRQTLEGKVKDEDIDDIVAENLKIMDGILESRKIAITKEEAYSSDDNVVAYLLSNKKSKGWIGRYWYYVKISDNLNSCF